MKKTKSAPAQGKKPSSAVLGSSTPISIPVPPRPCGFRIQRPATAGLVLRPDECAYATYVWRGATTTGVVAPPAGVYWGPGQTVRATLPSGAPATVAQYAFDGGVVFRNCPGTLTTAGVLG